MRSGAANLTRGQGLIARLVPSGHGLEKVTKNFIQVFSSLKSRHVPSKVGVGIKWVSYSKKKE